MTYTCKQSCFVGRYTKDMILSFNIARRQDGVRCRRSVIAVALHPFM